MTTVLVAVLCVGFGVWVTDTVANVCIARWKADRALELDRLALAQDRLALKRAEFDERRAAKSLTKRAEPMPMDLVARIGRWEDDWAREDERRLMQDLYIEYGSWDEVRKRMGSTDTVVEGMDQ